MNFKGSPGLVAVSVSGTGRGDGVLAIHDKDSRGSSSTVLLRPLIQESHRISRHSGASTERSSPALFLSRTVQRCGCRSQALRGTHSPEHPQRRDPCCNRNACISGCTSAACFSVPAEKCSHVHTCGVSPFGQRRRKPRERATGPPLRQLTWSQPKVDRRRTDIMELCEHFVCPASRQALGHQRLLHLPKFGNQIGVIVLLVHRT